jgi:hypothetical protein
MLCGPPPGPYRPFTIHDSVLLSQELQITVALRERTAGRVRQYVLWHSARISILVNWIFVYREGAAIPAHSAALNLFHMEGVAASNPCQGLFENALC